MNKTNLIVLGAGGHAHACIDVIENIKEYKIAGLIGTTKEKDTCYLGYKVFATDEDLPQLINEFQHAFIAVGQITSSATRIHLYKKLTAIGYKLPILSSPKAYVSRRAKIGEGTIIMHGAIINAGAKIGKNCIVNSCSLVEHDTIIEDHCHVSTGAIVNGNVHVGSGSFIGSGSLIKEGITIGKNCMVGMGLSVRKNLNDQTRLLSNC